MRTIEKQKYEKTWLTKCLRSCWKISKPKEKFVFPGGVGFHDTID